MKRMGLVILVLLFGLGVLIFKLERNSKRENTFEDAMRTTYLKCFKAAGYANPDTDKIPEKIVKQCDDQVEKKLGIEKN